MTTINTFWRLDKDKISFTEMDIILESLKNESLKGNLKYEIEDPYWLFVVGEENTIRSLLSSYPFRDKIIVSGLHKPSTLMSNPPFSHPLRIPKY